MKKLTILLSAVMVMTLMLTGMAQADPYRVESPRVVDPQPKLDSWPESATAHPGVKLDQFSNEAGQPVPISLFKYGMLGLQHEVLMRLMVPDQIESVDPQNPNVKYLSRRLVLRR